MSVKMRESADVVIFSMADQKYFTSARLGAGAGAAQSFRARTTGGPSRFGAKFTSAKSFQNPATGPPGCFRRLT